MSHHSKTERIVRLFFVRLVFLFLSFFLPFFLSFCFTYSLSLLLFNLSLSHIFLLLMTYFSPSFSCHCFAPSLFACVYILFALALLPVRALPQQSLRGLLLFAPWRLTLRASNNQAFSLTSELVKQTALSLDLLLSLLPTAFLSFQRRSFFFHFNLLFFITSISPFFF